MNLEFTKAESKILKKTLNTILGHLYHENISALSRGATGDPHKMGRYGQLYNAVHGGKNYENASITLAYLEEQYIFLSNNKAEVFNRAPGSFSYIADKLAPIMVKVRARVKLLKGDKQ